MLTYALEKNGSSSLYTQLYGCIRRDILSGALPPRQKLPSKRALAQHLEVSVIHASSFSDIVSIFISYISTCTLSCNCLTCCISISTCLLSISYC